MSCTITSAICVDTVGICQGFSTIVNIQFVTNVGRSESQLSQCNCLM